jgi:hypothetical protein
MADLGHRAVARWRANPISFIEETMVDPETRRPFKLLPAERAFLEHAFETDDDGRLRYLEQVYSCPKKSGKTTEAAAYADADCCLVAPIPRRRSAQTIRSRPRGVCSR